MSHNYNFDIAVLESLLRAPKRPPYIALLGPRKRFNQMREEIGDRGTAFSWDEVHNPAGLDLGAETPDEIALSITSEILAGLRGRSAGMLKDKTGFIHDRKNEKDLSFA
jgi:xanthine/CO dehydrogenase XdhC/CoxF family maturation factor